MPDQMKKFMEFVSANQDAFSNIGETTKEEIIAAAMSKGFELTQTDFGKQYKRADFHLQKRLASVFGFYFNRAD